MASTHERIAIVRRGAFGGLQFDTYESEFALVKSLINNGALAENGCGWGGVGHKKAVLEVQRWAEQVLKDIRTNERNSK